MNVTIVIPTYNEADALPPLIGEINDVMGNKSYEILVVDDNSPDGTARIAKKLPHTRVLLRTKDKGLSPAVVAGINDARGKFVIVMDADGSHPPKLIPKLVHALKSHDMAIGSRLIEGGAVEDWPVQRKLLSWGARMLARPLTSIKDTMSGFFALRKELIEGVDLKPQGYKIMLEILIRTNPARVKEVPYVFRNREIGESKISKKVCVEYVKQLAQLYKSKF